MRATSLILSTLAAVTTVVRGQTISTTDALGDIIIEFETIDPILGEPVTSILETIPATTTSTDLDALSTTTTSSTTTSTSTTAVDALSTSTTTTATAAAAATPYNGVSPTTGTILDYSAWLSVIGTATQVGYGTASTAQADTSGAAHGALPAMWPVLGAALLGTMGGAAVFLA
ncbi:hypothetical protein PENSPDRAFT_750803 [Peniophora sp. CONT]|nr:hypothetical protein PENSPDRAFT_750803 [Peniophora sp. CONT]